MDLFNDDTSNINLLPHDGIVNYYGTIMEHSKTQACLNWLLHNIAWKNDEVIIFGKHYITRRKTAWYGNQPYAYTYSNITRKALPWPKELLELKNIVENRSDLSFNSCLLNLYHNGDEGMGWHSDNEKPLGENPVIASLSFGAARKFSLKHKSTKQRVSKVLESGSLLVMKGTTQNNWLHSIPKTKKVKTPRVNLTFRTFIDP